MKHRLLMLSIAAVFPLIVSARGSHDDGHHHQSDQPRDTYDDRTHASAVGGLGVATAVIKIVRVDLLDSMRFAFDTPLALNRGDVVHSVVTNRGQLRHEFSIGSTQEQDAHRAMMRKMPDMVHEDANTVTVEPGDAKELIWRFEGDDADIFACNIPGHAEAGMVATAMLKQQSSSQIGNKR